MGFLTLLTGIAAAVVLAVYLSYISPANHAFATWWLLLPAASIYLISHCLRALRIFLLLYDGRVRVGESFLAHLHAAGVSALIPFKLGELYRIAVFDRLIHNPIRALMTVWVERIWDAGALLLLLLLLVAVAKLEMEGLGRLAAMTLAFLFASGFLFLVLPENLNMIKRYLIIRQEGERALWALAMVDRFHRVLTTAATLLRYRILTIAWLTIGIWALECGALLLVLESVGAPVDEAPGLLTSRLTELNPWAIPAGGTAAAAYRAATLDPLVAAALITLVWATIIRGAAHGIKRRRASIPRPVEA